jgi:pilus assembly protein TadC
VERKQQAQQQEKLERMMREMEGVGADPTRVAGAVLGGLFGIQSAELKELARESAQLMEAFADEEIGMDFAEREHLRQKAKRMERMEDLKKEVKFSLSVFVLWLCLFFFLKVYFFLLLLLLVSFPVVWMCLLVLFLFRLCSVFCVVWGCFFFFFFFLVGLGTSKHPRRTSKGLGGD